MDMMGQMKFARLVASGGAITRSTNRKRDSPEEVNLRKACSNQVVVGLMDMLGDSTQQKDAIIVVSTKAWERWFGATSIRLRSCVDSGDWIHEQLSGGFFAAVLETFGVLSDPSKLHYMRFLLPTREQLLNLDQMEVEHHEEQMAAQIGHLVCAINFHRIKRFNHFLLGWDARSVFFAEAKTLPTTRSRR